MNYDDWKLEDPEDSENQCAFCGEYCQREFCNRECEKAYLND